MSELAERFDTHDPGEKRVAEKIRCDACPVMCYIAEGRTGACDRYGNAGGRIVRTDPLVILDHAAETGAAVVPFLAEGEAWNGELVASGRRFVSGIGAGTTYPDYKPAPFIVAQEVEGVDLVTVVTEGIFSYCGVKVKIDTDRHIGPEAATVRVQGEAVGHVTTAEYGSQMLSLGGVHHLTGGSKAEGRVTCDTLLALCNKQPVELTVDGGATLTVQAGRPPVIDGKAESRMRVGCGSAAIGMFAAQWHGLVDEVVVVDDHITGVVSEHQAGKVLGWEDTGIRIVGRRSTPGRYFKVSEPGLGWGGTAISDPLSILGEWNPKKGARPGLSLLMVSTTGEQFAYYELDEALRPVEKPFPERLRKSVDLIEQNCEPALCTVLFVGGAGGSLRAGVTENPVNLTRSVQGLQTYVTVGGAPVYVWPGGGITLMVDVSRVSDNAFGYVPTPALVAPIEFTLRRDDYVRLGGYEARIRSVGDILGGGGEYLNPRRAAPAPAENAWPPLAQLRRTPRGGQGS
ncbi:MAG: 6-hydroxynicotinate reductase [Mesorhizobium sp.]